MLPDMKRNIARSKAQEIAFGGYDHNAVVREGQLWDMKNLSPELYPALSPRRGRTLERTLGKANGLYAHGELCWVDGTDFVYGGAVKGQVSDGLKSFASLGAYVLIFPDKAYYNAAKGEFGALEASWTGSAVITNYKYDSESAEAGEVYRGNAISTTGTPFPFEAGEAVVITGSSVDGNNRTPVIREVRDNGKLLVFSNNTFTEHAAQRLTLKRTVPDMDYFCESENRLWGCKGNEIYACALGNPFRWNNYEGLATDSYAVTVGSRGDFTGACTYLGYPIFFKADAIHKMYGSKPSNFQVMTSAVGGVADGAGGSLAVAAESLFYLGRNGMTLYTGGIPTSVAAPFGEERFSVGYAGSDGGRYYVCLCREGESGGTLFCYDPRTGLWHKEAVAAARWFACAGGKLCFLESGGKLWSVGTAGREGVEWMAETGDFTDNASDKTGVVRLQIRLELDEGSTAEAAVQFDSDGVWRPVRSLAGGRKRSVVLPVIPRRCDHYRIRLAGVGGCRVFGVTREWVRGSEV